MITATSIMKPRVAGNGEQTMRTAASAVLHSSAGAPEQAQTLEGVIDQREGRPLEQFGRAEFHGDPSPDQLDQFDDHIGQAEGDQQLGHMAVFVHLAQALALEDGAQGADHQGRNQQGRPESDKLGHGVTDIRAQHVKTGVRKIEHAHHAENQRESRTQHEQQEPVAQAVQHRDDEKLHSG
jgi:hypothetical protein